MNIQQKFVSVKLRSSSSTFIRTYYASASLNLPSELESAIEQKVKTSRERLNRLRSDYGATTLESVNVKTILGGLRNSNLLLCETSQVDPVLGLSYRGIPIQQLLTMLPKGKDPNCPPLTEGLFWLLLTGNIPTSAQVEILQRELLNRMHVPDHVVATIDALPASTHPMTQLVVGITACQNGSNFSAKYKAGVIKKDDYWRVVLDDGLSLVAKLPQIASQVYYRAFRDSNASPPPSVDPSLDWAANTAHLMGFDNTAMKDVFRLYMFLHADHEGGNVSAHAAHLVGSALSDPYLSFAASMTGLAGPLHGLANQECLRFLRVMNSYLLQAKLEINEANVHEYIQSQILGKGRVVPGFGHAVLRAIDPRFSIQRQFAIDRIQNDDLTNLLGICAAVVPKILASTGKVSNPYPNVDAHSGVILSYFGMKEAEFYTVLFGISRSIGVVSQLVWDRAFNLPIERPKSITLEQLEQLALKHSEAQPTVKF